MVIICHGNKRDFNEGIERHFGLNCVEANKGDILHNETEGTCNVTKKQSENKLDS